MTGITPEGVEIDRLVSAPIAHVFAAFAQAEAFSQWFGGTQASVPLDQLDWIPTPGQNWSARMVLPDGNSIDWVGVFVEVQPHSLLSFTITDMPENPEQALVTVQLEEAVEQNTGDDSQPSTVIHMTQETPGFSDEQKQGLIMGYGSFLDVLASLVER